MQVGIYQKTPQHTEVCACFIELFKTIFPACQVIVFYDHDAHYANFLPYYKKFFDFEIRPCDSLQEYDLRYLVLTTLHNLTAPVLDFIFPFKERCFLVNHRIHWYKRFSEAFPALHFFRIINLFPHNKIPNSHYIFPIHTADNVISSYSENAFALVGNLNPEKQDLSTLMQLLETYDFELRIVCHGTYGIKERLKGYNVKYYINVPTETLIKIIKGCKGVLGLAKEDYLTERLSGIIPVAVSANVPLILSSNPFEIDCFKSFEEALNNPREESSERLMVCKKKIQEKNLTCFKTLLLPEDIG